jgi:very-short-patch-repair endonuclease
MGYQSDHESPAGVWALARQQHGVVTRAQLLMLGFSARSIKHRIAKGRLHPVWRGVYAVGRPELTLHGRWLAAVMSCGPGAVLSHGSAAALWKICPVTTSRIEVSLRLGLPRRPKGIVVHRRTSPGEATRHCGVPVTTPIFTLIDLATLLGREQLEAAVNEADRLDLTDPEELRAALDKIPRRHGIALMRELLDRRTFTFTDSELERHFLLLVRTAGLPAPLTGRYVNGFKVDFYWPDLGLVVETDGLRYHRTPAQQTRDRVRDQAHAAAGLAQLRFTHAQIRFEPTYVRETLLAVARQRRT